MAFDSDLMKAFMVNNSRTDFRCPACKFTFICVNQEGGTIQHECPECHRMLNVPYIPANKLSEFNMTCPVCKGDFPVKYRPGYFVVLEAAPIFEGYRVHALAFVDPEDKCSACNKVVGGIVAIEVDENGFELSREAASFVRANRTWVGEILSEEIPEEKEKKLEEYFEYVKEKFEEEE